MAGAQDIFEASVGNAEPKMVEVLSHTLQMIGAISEDPDILRSDSFAERYLALFSPFFLFFSFFSLSQAKLTVSFLRLRTPTFVLQSSSLTFCPYLSEYHVFFFNFDNTLF